MVIAYLKPYKIVACGLSDIGLQRQNNEDVWAQLPDDSFFALADGMGGHQGGEVAARETIDLLCRVVRKKINPVKDALPLSEVKDLVRKAIRHVNAAIFKMSREKLELKGMGTTLCCLLFHESGFIYGHVGDSRIYRYRNRQLVQLTKDHSLLRDLVDQGQLDEQQASDFMYKNIITKAIGTEPKVEPSIDFCELGEGDLYLMCSDGLSDLLSTEEIETIIEMGKPPQERAAMLVAKANEKGGRDNITVVIINVEPKNGD